ncbi:MAG: DNA polymerase III subunit epsilon [Rhodoferax sp.]|nr:DNA polymerase III subunit epsilon [Rhodoferax sp.]MBP7491806.1 DNA polymerase III subunit epsilon [Rhodoferax sp.]
MLPCYVLLDLETTGGSPVRDRITEIAAVRVEAGQEVARWSTLVNPGCSVSPFIENLTGISTAMVATAPSFSEVAAQLLALLKDAVLVAHNVRFDHGFLLNEFARAEIALRAKTLCTVRLSRALYPQHRSHGLDAIMQRHGLSTLDRHRAMGDVDMVSQWLRQAETELGAEHVAQHALVLLQGSAALPPQLETHVGDIPETAGVYSFYGEGTLPLYIGKSIKMRSRVMSHFQAATREAREMRISQEIRRIEWVETAGELGALLLEARRVKDQQPVYNRQLRRETTLCAWRLEANPSARPLVKLVRGEELDPREFDRLYGVYRSKNQALSSLRELADTHTLCLQALGLESGKGRCFAQQIGRCKGVCCGLESPELHYLRLKLALAQQQLHVWPHTGKVGLREFNASTGRTDIHIFDQWCHLATVHDDGELEDALTQSSPALAFDLDTYRLLYKHLSSPGKAGVELIRFPARD